MGRCEAEEQNSIYHRENSPDLHKRYVLLTMIYKFVFCVVSISETMRGKTKLHFFVATSKLFQTTVSYTMTWIRSWEIG